MRGIENSMDVHGVRYTERRKRLEKIKRVNDVEKKEKVTPAEYYESRGMTKEDKERETTMTPQEAFRREMANTQNTKAYRQLQKDSKIEDKEESKEQEEKEPEI